MPNNEGTVDAGRVKNRLKDAGWSFKDQTPRRYVWRKPGNPMPLLVPQNVRFAEKTVRELLRFAGLTMDEIDSFVGANIGQ